MSIDKANIKHRFTVFLIISTLSLISYDVSADIIPVNHSNDTIAAVPIFNYLNYGFDKITDTYIFMLNGNYQQATDIGDFSIMQNYRGVGLRQSTTSFRDDENFSFRYSFPLSDRFSVSASQNYIYSSDMRTGGNNVLSRVNAIGGAEFKPDKNISLRAGAGYEMNRQLQVKSPGTILNFEGRVSNYSFSNFVLNSSVFGEHLMLDRDRSNSDLDIMSGIMGINNNDIFDLNLNYRLMKRDMLSGFSSASDTVRFETRLENKLSPDIRVLFNIIPELSADIRFNISDQTVEKYYKKPDENNQVSRINRIYNELQYGINFETNLNLRNFKQITGLSYYSRNEENRTLKMHEIDPDEFDALRSMEFLRDNNTIRTRLYSSSSYNPSAKDTFGLLMNVRKFRYDTPSDDNKDDRDEVSYNFLISYRHRFSSGFSVDLNGEVQLQHLVFLKSERSAMNNWNRIFRFGPEFSWKTIGFSMNPRLEVLSNYTIYDFEDKTGNIRSYSFRQIGYRDTLSITLHNDLYLQSRLNIRYFERGILYWDTFSESPQNNNLEYFAKLLFVSEQWDKLAYGIGGRIFSLTQKNITSGTISVNEFNQLSWGPEVFLRYRFANGSNISLQGWYEFLYINMSKRNNIPNLFLYSSIVI